MSKENKKKTCPLSSNFAFAIVALLATGLLLYTTVEVFNCKQDIAQINERIQNSPKFVSVHSEQKIEEQGKDNLGESDTKKVEGECEKLIQSDPGIVYNSDGTIDTSKWTLYKNEKYGFELLIPDFMELSDTSCKPDEYCKYPEDFFMFNRKNENNGNVFFGKNENKCMFAEITLTIEGKYGVGYEKEKGEKIVFGKKNDVIGFISKGEEYKEYLNGVSARIVLKDKKNWKDAFLTFDTSRSCWNTNLEHKEMKLLFDAILNSFNY